MLRPPLRACRGAGGTTACGLVEDIDGDQCHIASIPRVREELDWDTRAGDRGSESRLLAVLPALLYIAAMVAAMPGTPAMPENTEPDRREAPAPATGWSPFDAFFGPPGPPRPGAVSWLWARFLFLRALGLVFFSAFYSLAFQIHGLLGPHGILPAGTYLAAVARAFPVARFWYAPTLLWLSA